MHSTARPMPARALLDLHALDERADDEISRARRYRRDLALLTLELRNAAEQRLYGATVLRMLRRWDFIGVYNADQPVLVVVLPETGRSGAEALVHRLHELLPEAPMGTAAFPADGARFEALIEVARWRAGAEHTSTPTALPRAGGR